MGQQIECGGLIGDTDHIGGADKMV